MAKRKPDTGAIYISPRLRASLEPVGRCALTVVTAPMGYGKTTAVNWFLGTQPPGCAIRISIYSDSLPALWQSGRRAFRDAGLTALEGFECPGDPASAGLLADTLCRELRRQEERIDGLEDALGTFLVRLGGRTLTRRDSARAAELLMLMGDLERLGDHAMNLLESGEELRDRKIELPPEDRRQLRVLTEAVEEIADLALAAFRREDAAALGQVEALEQVIDGLRQRLRARRIRETQPGEGAMELSFVWSDVLTDLERAADHCCNIMECVADLSAGNRNLHAAQLAVRQRDPAFDSRVRAYEQKYRI